MNKPQAVNVSVMQDHTAQTAEQRLRLVIDAAPNAMLMADESGAITLVNTQATQLFGYSRDELLSMKIEALVPGHIRAAHKGLRKDYFDNPNTRAMGAGRDLHGLRKDGTEVPIEIGLNPLRTDEGLFVLASIIDISERKNAEERFRLMVEAAPNAMLTVNRQGRMTLVNTQTEKLFGYSREELLGQTVEMLVPMNVRGSHPKMRDQFFSSPSARSMGAGRDLYGLTKTGREVPIEIGLNPIETPEGILTLASIIDITERKRAETLSRQAHTDILRQSILDSIPFSVIAMNLEGRIITVNPATLRMLDYRREEIVGKEAAKLLHVPGELEHHASNLSQEMGKPIAADHHAVIAKAQQGIQDENEWTYRSKHGEHIPVQVSITPLYGDDEQLTGVLKVAYDISERKRAEALIMRMAHHDDLTGLPNRALLMDRLEMAIKQAHKRNELVGVLLLDLDNFKRVNDSLGHHVGDQMLVALSHRLQNQLRDGDTLARLGGDEFVIVLPEVESRETMQRAVDRIVQHIATPILIGEQELLVTPSIGGAIYPNDGEDAQTLIKNADSAMYAAKGFGRSNAQWFSKEMLRQNQRKLLLTAALKPALESNQFHLVYQPEISLQTGATVGVEALIRWQHPTLGSISPEEFIPLAEETGLILPIGAWVMRTACAEIAQLRKQLNLPIVAAINVSPRQLQHEGWLIEIMHAMKESGLSGSSLELEITEGMLIQNPSESAELLREVRRMGVSIAMDDFGTGYSSLSYLTRFPIDKLKIDRSFVRDITLDSNDAAVVDAIIAMSHSLGLQVVAEGVETLEQLDYLRRRYCNLVQGYFFSPPVTAKELPATLRRVSRQISDITQSST